MSASVTDDDLADIRFMSAAIASARRGLGLTAPTPAVGGGPTSAAVDVIAELEGGRGFYAGAVGWCDDRGDGRWVVAIRGAQLSADRRSALAVAGGGIVAESDAHDEVAETTTKFRTILTALGVS